MTSVQTALLVASIWLPAQNASDVDYLRDVKPILSAHCYTCHGAIKQKAGLRVDTVAFMKEGGDHGGIVEPGGAEQTLLLKHVLGRTGYKRMPPEKEGEALKPVQVAVLRRWIAVGAQGPKEEQPERDPREHWAFRAPIRPDVPQVNRVAWTRNPIDAFIASGHQKRSLTPQPPAERGLLLRRIYLDLIGLPPTREELQAFLADDSPDAYEKVVDRLLASPQYGERWARHWMDVWRYSDWWGLGAELRNSQRHIWHWRDWIVDSLNQDRGYDQMLTQMLAADEFYPTDSEALRATGFLARHYFKFNRTTWLDETIEHTGKAFLGLTFNCCKCHDHKYDPFSQVDYYRFRALFEAYQIRLDNVPGEVDLEKDGLPRVYDAHLTAPTYFHVRGNEANADKNRKIEPGLPRILLKDGLDIRPIPLPKEAYQPGLRPFVLQDHLRLAEKQLVSGQEELSKAATPLAKAAAEKKIAHALASKKALEARAAADRAAADSQANSDKIKEITRGAAVAEKALLLAQAEWNLARVEAGKTDLKLTVEQARAAVGAARKSLEKPGDAYTPLTGALKTLESNLESEAARRAPFPRESTGRRSALARWLADRKNPLTARVAVNHLWAWHFGEPLVSTVFDFGRKGAAPTHPELLEWLAVELMDGPSGAGTAPSAEPRRWRMKHLHRLLVTSNTYRMASSAPAVPEFNAKVDGDNRFFWRMNPLRMESQVVRDSLLHLAGELDLTLGGPSVEIPQQEASRRRSLYFFHSAIERNKFLTTFDEADPLDCYRRRESIVPQQALALSNSKLAVEMAYKMVARLEKTLGAISHDAFAREAFTWTLGRAPSASELAACAEAVERWLVLGKNRPPADAARRARMQLVLALLNHNDFITIR